MSCHDCKHRGTLPGDAHIQCNHPKATIACLRDAKLGTAETDRGTLDVVIFPSGESLLVVGELYGYEQGWFHWPMNFDPGWLLGCTGYAKVRS